MSKKTPRKLLLLSLIILALSMPGCVGTMFSSGKTSTYLQELDAAPAQWKSASQFGFDGDGCPRLARSLKLYGYEIVHLIALHKHRQRAYPARLQHLETHPILDFGAIRNSLLREELQAYFSASTDKPDLEYLYRLLATARGILSERAYLADQREAAFLLLGIWTGLIQMYPASEKLYPLLDRTYLALERKLEQDNDPLFSHIVALRESWRDYNAHLDVVQSRQPGKASLEKLDASIDHLLGFDHMTCAPPETASLTRSKSR